MGYKKSKHYNAVLKYVKEKEIVLQKDVQSIMNGTIQTACEQLANDGKIKREKVKMRFKNGNLNNAWALYVPGIDYNKVIEFEKELVNRPFESPLKEHHCYKRTENSITEFDHNSNVIDMHEYVKVNGNELSIKEFNGERVVTFKDIDNVHQRPSGTAKRNFNNNRKYFVEGKHFYEISPNKFQRNEIRTFGINSNKGGYLITERGYMKLIKSFTDELSWMVQDELVDTYFNVKQLKTDPETKNIPQVQNIKLYDVMEMMVGEMRSHNDRITQLENAIGGIAQALIK